MKCKLYTLANNFFYSLDTVSHWKLTKMAANYFNTIKIDRLFTTYHKLPSRVAKHSSLFCARFTKFEALVFWARTDSKKWRVAWFFNLVSFTWSRTEWHGFTKSAMFSVFASTAPKELIGRVPNSRSVGFAKHTRLSFLLLPPRCTTRLPSASSPSSKSSSWSSSPSSTTSFAGGDEGD